MNLVNVKCPNCGAEIQLDGDRVEGFCSYCGAKVQVQEAFSVMKAGKASEIQNFISLANAALEVNNGEEAYTYANKVLEIELQNSEGWYLKMVALGALAILKDLKCDDILAAGKKAMEYDTSDDMKQRVYGYFLQKCQRALLFCENQLLDTTAIKDLYDANVNVDISSASEKTLAADMICDMILRQRKQILNLRLAVPNAEISKDQYLAAYTTDVANAWVRFQNAVNNRFKTYGMHMTDEALAEYKNDLALIKQGLSQEYLAQTTSETAMNNDEPKQSPTAILTTIGGIVLFFVIVWWIFF